MSWRLFPRLRPNAIPEFILVIIIRFVLVIIIIVHKNVIPILVFEAIGRSQMHWLCIDFALSMPPQVSWCPHRDLHIYKVLFPNFNQSKWHNTPLYFAICLQAHINPSLQFVFKSTSSFPCNLFFAICLQIQIKPDITWPNTIIKELTWNNPESTAPSHMWQPNLANFFYPESIVCLRHMSRVFLHIYIYCRPVLALTFNSVGV